MNNLNFDTNFRVIIPSNTVRIKKKKTSELEMI